VHLDPCEKLHRHIALCSPLELVRAAVQQADARLRFSWRLPQPEDV
jgi:hypothetical protein